jgi:hypothetical protein
MKLHLAAMSNIPAKQTRREFMMTWGGAVLEQINQLLKRPDIDVRNCLDWTLVVDRLLQYLPSAALFLDVQLKIYYFIVKPQLYLYDKLVCAYDGQVVRYDVTWKCAKTVYASSSPSFDQKDSKRPVDTGNLKNEPKKTKFLKLGAGVLTVTGFTGLALECPKLVPSEAHEFIKGSLLRVCNFRRLALGPMACPIAFGCDNMSRDHKMLTMLLRTAWPELDTLCGQNIHNFVLFCEDLVHVNLRFDRCVPQRKTASIYSDVRVFTSAMHAAVNRCRLPHTPSRFITFSEWKRPAPQFLRDYTILELSPADFQGLLKLEFQAAIQNDDPDPDWVLVMQSLFNELGEKNLQQLTLTLELNGSHALPLFVLITIAKNLDFDRFLLDIDVGYENELQLLCEAKAIFNWFQVPRCAEQKSQISQAEEIAEYVKVSSVTARAVQVSTGLSGGT